MRSRTAATVLASLGLSFGGAAATVAPALAASATPTTVDTTPGSGDGSATAAGDATSEAEQIATTLQALVDDGTITQEQADALSSSIDSAAGDATAATDAAPDTTTAADDATSGASGGRPFLSSRIDNALQPLIDDGTLTQEQADAVVAAIVDALPGRDGRGGGLGVSLDTLTEVLGVTADDLQTAFADDQSIADVAAAQGVDVQTVIDALVTAGTERIDQAVTDGRLTEEEAATRTAALTERITELVNQAGGPNIGGPMSGGQMGPGNGQSGHGQMGPGNGGPNGNSGPGGNGQSGPGNGGPGHGNGSLPDAGVPSGSTPDSQQ